MIVAFPEWIVARLSPLAQSHAASPPLRTCSGALFHQKCPLLMSPSKVTTLTIWEGWGDEDDEDEDEDEDDYESW